MACGGAEHCSALQGRVGASSRFSAHAAAGRPRWSAACGSAIGDGGVGARRTIVVVYRKGELTRKAIDRNWPHQVALPTPISSLWEIQDFCRAAGLSLCQRTTGFYREVGREVIWYACFCFADRAHAGKFQARFGGEFVDPQDRPKWPGRR